MRILYILMTSVMLLFLSFLVGCTSQMKSNTEKQPTEALLETSQKPVVKEKKPQKLTLKTETSGPTKNTQKNYFIEGKMVPAATYEMFKSANLKVLLNRKQSAVKFNKYREVIGELTIDQYQNAKGEIFYLRRITTQANGKTPETVDFKIDQNKAQVPDVEVFEIEDEMVTREQYEKFRKDNFFEDAGEFPVGDEPDNEKNEDPNEEYIVSTHVKMVRFANKDEDFFEEVVRTEIKGQGYPVTTKYSIKRVR